MGKSMPWACFFMSGIYPQIEENINQMRCFKKILSWCKKEEGSTAIEFAMLSLPFMYVLIGTMEISLMFATNSVLDGAVTDAARMIRTGQVQQASGNPEDVFKTKLCDKAKVLLDCTKLQYEVVPMAKFADFNSYAAKYDSNGNLISRGFSPGGVNSVNLIRVSYRYNLATPFIGQFLANGPNNSRLMTSTVVLETEPYDLAAVAGSL